MQDIRNSLEAELKFYRKQERWISARLAILPKGQIKAKMIGRNVCRKKQVRSSLELALEVVPLERSLIVYISNTLV